MSLKGHSLGYWRLKLQAMTLLVFARNASAERTFDTMLSLWPGDAYALASRAHVLAARGARELAIADAQALVARHPQRSAADWFNLAYLLEKPAATTRRSRPSGAPSSSIRSSTGPGTACGLTLIRLQRLDEAVEALKHNTQLQPMSPYGWYQLARVHLDRHEPDETRKIIRHLHSFEPRSRRSSSARPGWHPDAGSCRFEAVCWCGSKAPREAVNRGPGSRPGLATRRRQRCKCNCPKGTTSTGVRT